MMGVGGRQHERLGTYIETGRNLQTPHLPWGVCVDIDLVGAAADLGLDGGLGEVHGWPGAGDPPELVAQARRAVARAATLTPATTGVPPPTQWVPSTPPRPSSSTAAHAGEMSPDNDMFGSVADIGLGFFDIGGVMGLEAGGPTGAAL